jgi:peptidase E
LDKQTPVYLFAGGRGKSILSTFQEIGRVVNSSGKQKPEIALVGVASLRDNWLVTIIMTALIKTGCRCRVRRVKIAHKNDDINRAKNVLAKADVIFMGGGDAEVGMQILKEKGLLAYFRDLLEQGKLLLGVSAGTIMMCKEWVRWQDPGDDATAELFPCLGLAPVICDTHAEGDDWEELKAALQLEKEGTAGYGIPSGAYLRAYPDGKLEAGVEAVVRFTRANALVIRMPDLLP